MSAVNLPLASVPVATSKEENLTVRSQNYYYLALLKDQGHDNCFIFIFSISSGLCKINFVLTVFLSRRLYRHVSA